MIKDKKGPDKMEHIETLDARRIEVITALVEGETVSAVAKRSGLSRSTIHRWLKEDFAFQAALNQYKRGLFEEVQTRLLKLAESATDVVQESLERSEVSTALAVLKGIGLLQGTAPMIGSDNPEALRRDSELREIIGI